MKESRGSQNDTLLLEIVREIKDNIIGKLAGIGGGLPVETASAWVESVNDVELLQTLEALADSSLRYRESGKAKKTLQGAEMMRLFSEYNACGATITDRQAAFLLQRIARASLTAEESGAVWKGFLDLASTSPISEGYLLLVALGALILASHAPSAVSRAAESLMVLGDYHGSAGLLGWLHEKAISTLSPGSPSLEAATGMFNLTENLLSLRERYEDDRRLKALGNSTRAIETCRVVGVSAGIELARKAVADAATGGGTPIIYGEPGTGKRHLAEFFHAAAAPGETVFHVDLCSRGRGDLKELMCGRIGSVLPNLRPPRGILTMAGRGTVVLHGAHLMDSGDLEFLRVILARREFRPVDDTSGPYLPVRARFVMCFESGDPIFPGSLSRAVPAGFAASIGGVPVHLPPLRSRVDDIPWLADHFVNSPELPDWAGEFSSCGSRQGERRVLDKACRERLKAYFWPRNVDELKKVAQAMAALSSGRVIHETFLPERILGRYRRGKETT